MQELIRVEDIRKIWDSPHEPFDVLAAIDRERKRSGYLYYPFHLAGLIEKGLVHLSKEEVERFWRRFVYLLVRNYWISVKKRLDNFPIYFLLPRLNVNCGTLSEASGVTLPCPADLISEFFEKEFGRPVLVSREAISF